MSYKFFQNTECEYFPCHPKYKTDVSKLNCLFCYCPLYPFEDCGGEYVALPNGVKDCSGCCRPHEDYDGVVKLLYEKYFKE